MRLIGTDEFYVGGNHVQDNGDGTRTITREDGSVDTFPNPDPCPDLFSDPNPRRIVYWPEGAGLSR